MIKREARGPFDQDQVLSGKLRLNDACAIGAVNRQMMRSDPTKTSGRRKISSTPGRLDCATAFQRIALDCVARVKAHRNGACAGNSEAVHQIRVAFTRLRAAVSFFAPMTADAEWRHLKKEIVWLNASLGAVRDSDVIAEYGRSKRYRTWTQRLGGLKLDTDRARDHRALVRCLHSRRFRGLMKALSGWIEHGSWLRRWERNARGKPAEPLEAYCERELKRWHQRLIRKGRRLETLGTSRRHRLRIRTKRFRYMLEALTEIVPVYGRDEFHHLHSPRDACSACWAIFAISNVLRGWAPRLTTVVQATIRFRAIAGKGRSC